MHSPPAPTLRGRDSSPSQEQARSSETHRMAGSSLHERCDIRSTGGVSGASNLERCRQKALRKVEYLLEIACKRAVRRELRFPSRFEKYVFECPASRKSPATREHRVISRGGLRVGLGRMGIAVLLLLCLIADPADAFLTSRMTPSHCLVGLGLMAQTVWTGTVFMDHAHKAPIGERQGMLPSLGSRLSNLVYMGVDSFTAEQAALAPRATPARSSHRQTEPSLPSEVQAESPRIVVDKSSYSIASEHEQERPLYMEYATRTASPLHGVVLACVDPSRHLSAPARYGTGQRHSSTLMRDFHRKHPVDVSRHQGIQSRQKSMLGTVAPPSRWERNDFREQSRSNLRLASPPVDRDGHISPNVTRVDRFEILQMIDKGTFGTVFMAWDSKWRQNIALKVVRRVARYVEDAEFEVSILEQLADLDRGGRYCVKLYKYFHHYGHFCIVTELLGSSLYHSLKKIRQSKRMLSMGTIWRVARQLCEALAFLRSVKLVHADLKTENILLARPDMNLEDKNMCIKLIDFGGATWEDDMHSKVIQTRHYRAPEVVLGLDWTYPCDMWSVGCILLELYEGKLTFDTHDTAQHLAMIQRLAGQVPEEMVRRVPKETSVERLFDKDRRLKWPQLSPTTRHQEAVSKVARLTDRIDAHHHDFGNLLSGMLQIDPERRLTPVEALESTFLRQTVAR